MPAAELRAGFERLLAAMPTGPEMALVEDYVTEAAAPVRLYVPQKPVRTLMLHLHGGGWTLGSISENWLSRNGLVGWRIA